MALIIKKGSNFKNMDKKKAYTWGACALVFLLVLFTLIGAMAGSDEGKPDDFSNLSSRNFDLAQLPFVNDEAEKELLAKYNDISGVPDSTLFTPEEKEARQEADALSEEEAPDAEYEAALKELSARNTPAPAPASSAYSSYGSGVSKPATQIGTMSKGSMVSGGGGGLRGTSWTPGNASASNAKTANTKVSKEMLAKLSKTERGRSLLQAYAESSAGAKKDGEGALSGAMAAFQGGKATAELDTDLETAMAELALDETAGIGGQAASEGPSIGDVAKAVKDGQEKKDRQIPEPKPSFWAELGKQMLKGLVDGATQIAIGQANQQISIKTCVKGSKEYGFNAADCFAKPGGGSSGISSGVGASSGAAGS
ncbi:hypothetical protein Emin_0644 [Elusimicrobium minutum Pei191]|uniref:Uncharacterized protein n=1 Tax=Elusimicrobium minutum (strain Pei191) TaxID=445932 RepID=B2KC72_ELUMP|nr:hypothetical protein [Elusimicrobium minutum]ACC98199.1 hypothetical protein Emin_0644 [Elusimicrobium minutum Pei191]